MKLNKNRILEKKAQLENHSLLVTDTIQTLDDLRIFMSHHVYAVWDFMSILKSIQHNIVPSGGTWVPNKGNRTELARMINEIVLCEESDVDLNGGHISHFDLYLQSMYEVGASTYEITNFINMIDRGSNPVFASFSEPASKFMDVTFKTINKGPHCAAASFCYGRETVIPSMFTRILNQLNINELSAPKFHYYLQRHIEVDGEEHGPMSEHLVEYFIDNDPIKLMEAENAAIESIEARIQLFDDIERLLILN